MSATAALASVRPASGNQLYRLNDLGLLTAALERAEKAGNVTDGKPFVTVALASEMLDEAAASGLWKPRAK